MSAPSQIGLLAKMLDVAHVRHEVIANNVANVNTPGYRRQDVDFEDAFTQALRAGDATATLSAKPQITAPGGGPERADGNNVDIDREIGQLNKNALQYKIYAQILAVQLAQQRSAVSGR